MENKPPLDETPVPAPDQCRDQDQDHDSSREPARERVRTRRKKRRRNIVVDDAKVVKASGRRRRKSRRSRGTTLTRRLAIAGSGAVLGAALIGIFASGIVDLRFLISGGYEVGLEQFEEQDYPGALRTLGGVLSADSDNLTARILLGRTYLRVGYAKEAEAEFRRSLSAGADANVIVEPLGQSLLAQGKFDDLFATLSPTVPDAGLRHKIMLLRGEAHLRLRELAAADEMFLGAIDLQPNSLHGVLGRASVARLKGDESSALQFIEQAIKHHPNSPDAWRGRANVQVARLDYENALADFARALEIAPSDERSRLERALLGVQLGQTMQVAVDLEALPLSMAESGEVLFVRALAAARQGDIEQAKALLERSTQRLVRLHSAFLRRHPPAHLVQGIWNLRSGKLDVAYEFLRRYLDYHPGDAFITKLTADVLIARGRARGAIDLLTPLLERAPHDVQALVLLGRAHLWLGDKASANEALKQAAERVPNATILQTDLAYSRLAQRQGDGARDVVDALITPAPGPIQAGALLATLQLRAGDVVGARATADRSVLRWPDEAAAHGLVGAVALYADDMPAARASLQRALGFDAAHLPSLRTMARLQRREGDLGGAVTTLNKILESDSGNVSALVGLARMASASGNGAAAVEWLEKVRASSAAPLAPLLELLELHLDAGRLQQAKVLVTELQSRFPRSLEVRVARGRVELAGGDGRRASQTFTTLAQTGRSSPERLLEYARYQLSAGDAVAARTTLAQALEADWNHVPAQLELARLDLNSSRFSEALARARMVAELLPGTVLAHDIAGDALMRLRRAKDAVGAYQLAFDVEQAPAFAVKLFEAKSAAGDPVGALASLEHWVKENDSSAQARRALAIGYMKVGRSDEALRAHVELVKQLTDDGLLHRNLAELYLEQGSPEALSFAERALRLDPRDPRVLDTLGWVLIANAEPKEALTHLREAHSRDARDPRIRFHIAVALEQLGRRDEAREELEAALAEGQPFKGEERARALLARL
jgi:putative PEP-CTERM system TPR-repeat lipoprotein